MNILQVGLGNFGKRHLEAWHRMGLGTHLRVAEMDPAKWELTRTFNVPAERLAKSADDFMDSADIVDVVTPTDSHFGLCRQAIERGKDVFVEKPMTMTSREARELADLAQRHRRLVQVGFYYRFHPISVRLRQDVAAGLLGKIRYVSGNFMGFKRARTDVGVTHTDGIHFLDLFNWLLGAAPTEVYAVCRDHFGRGLEDFSVVMLTYPGGVVGKVESGYVQPGRWKDKVVPGALTTKEITIVGERLTAEVDFETETLTLHDAHHELRGGTWAAVVGASRQEPVEPCDPVQMVARELEAFLGSVKSRQPGPGAGAIDGGVQLAVLMESIYESARTGRPVAIPGR
jgi:UDP-2-acetamido-3-amino-2,3-dideoxy-glucuronate N-acetyltransferase